MNENVITLHDESEKPAKPKRKYRRRYARRLKTAAPKAPPFKAPEEFAGMTQYECCDVCKENLAKEKPCCVISETNRCLHPMKSGIPPEFMNNPKVLARYMRAKKALAHQKIDLT